ncbi:hypothetical protein CKC_05880 [Candidatus Liberibacter solanacearum CLso-ZC1]|uniref:Uncharacterized protein n=1 Tax=Liberibacter solanacearum (strain CLso-ZC1) TaxID=658172 RepID=E4UC64_LIBSC|nr:hypothetical protein [Candidatus Liberibacter solanacearum]ADR51954.1 hypothetical protein CKC_01015 [Candidatus Liberibacter solanacearum CLso-ZC1]ADR52921.1 hypothetical protein CKC_05880 [Candidatus Liberibacter solanacearum CLso-ZC1]
MTYRQLRIKEHSISYVCTTSYYIIPWNFDDPTTVHAEFVKGEESKPLEYGEEFTVDCDEGMLTLLTDYNNSDTLHIFEGERLKYIAKSSAKHSHKTLTRRIDDCMEEINKIPPKIDKVEKEFKEEINKIPPKIDKVEKEFQEEIKNTATIVQVHSLSLTDQIKILDEHERRLAETATKEDLSNLKDLYVTPNELNLILENTSAKTQEAIKRLEQEIKGLKDASSSEVESLKNKLDNLISLRETLKKFKADIAEQITHLGNKTDRIETGARNLTEIVSRLCQKVDDVDIIQMDRDVTALASKSLEVAKTLETLEKKPPVDLKPLGARVEKVEVRVGAIENKSPVDLKPLDNRIKDLKNMIDALEARIANTEKHVCNGSLTLQATEQNKNPCISFKGQDGKGIAQMFTRDGNLFIGTNDNNLLTPDRVKIGGKTLKEHMENGLSGRTTIRCARLHTNESLGNIINSTSIDNWQYPAENSGGHLSHSVASAIGLDDADKRRRWKVIGKTVGYYGVWHWLQEVIE